MALIDHLEYFKFFSLCIEWMQCCLDGLNTMTMLPTSEEETLGKSNPSHVACPTIMTSCGSCAGYGR